MGENTISELSKAIKIGNDVIELEHSRQQQGEKLWYVYGSGLEKYGISFFDLPHGDIQKTVAIEKSHPVHVMDVMAEGQILRELKDISGGVALTATDARSEDSKEFDASKNIHLIDGNLVLSTSWNRATDYLKEQHIQGFDIAILRSAGGLDAAQLNTLKIQHLLASRMWERINPDGGILLFQYSRKTKQSIQTWIQKLEGMKYEVYDNGDAFEIVRHKENGSRLPIMSDILPEITPIADLTQSPRATLENIAASQTESPNKDPLKIDLDTKNSYYGEQIEYREVPLGNKITNRGVSCDFKMSGRLRRNLSDDPKRSSKIEISATNGSDDFGKFEYSFTNPQSSMLRALEIKLSQGQRAVLISGYVTSQLPHKGVRTALMEEANDCIAEVVTHAVNYGIYPSDTIFVRVIIDRASLTGWTALQTEARIAKGDQVKAVIPNHMYCEVIKTRAPYMPERIRTLQTVTEVKREELLEKIMLKQGNTVTDLEKLELPNFDPETGESLVGMQLTQLTEYLKSIS